MARKATIRKVPQSKPSKGGLSRRGFTPFVAPTRPPPSTYDPGLDAQERASQRGLADLLEDAGRRNLYSQNDYNFALEQLGLKRARGQEDYFRDKTRGQEDYGRNIQELDRSYNNLATAQTEGARASGTARGGALAQALRKRTENKAFDKAPIDTSFNRFNQDLETNQVRFTQDLDTEQGRLGVEFGRDWNDRNLVDIPRAQREATEFGLDVNAQRFYQARGSGYELPTRPENEHSRYGLTFRVGGQNKPLSQRTYTLPTGRKLSRGGFVNLVRRRRGQSAGGRRQGSGGGALAPALRG